MKTFTRISTLVASTLIIQICNAQEPSRDQINHLHEYMWANYQQFGGNNGEAAKWYDTLLQDKNKQPHFYKGYLTFLSDTGKFKELINLMPQLDKMFADDAEIQLLFAQALQKVGQIKESQERFISLSNKFKTDQTIVFQAANIYISRKEPENALATIDSLLNNSPKRPNNFIFHFLKAQIYAQNGQPQKALESIKTCINTFSQFDKGWLLFALLHEQAGQLNEAIKGYTNYLQLSQGTNPEIQQHLVQLAFKQKLAQQNKTTVVINQSCFTKSMNLFEQKNYQGALKQIELCLQEKPEDKESKLLKIQILSAAGQHAQAAHQLKAWILKDPDNQVWFDALQLLCRTGLKYQKAISVLEDVAHHQPTNMLAILNLADLHLRARNFASALRYHKNALDKTNDKHLKTKLLFNMAIVYYDQQNFDAMEKALEQGLALNTNFAPLLNLLAYHYATHNKKLDVAQQLMTTVLQTHKNNPHFLDTQALIYYQQKEYEKALTILTTLAQREPSDAAILHTLGKTYFQLGKKDEAIESIQKAQKLASNAHDKHNYAALLSSWQVHQ